MEFSFQQPIPRDVFSGLVRTERADARVHFPTHADAEAALNAPLGETFQGQRPVIIPPDLRLQHCRQLVDRNFWHVAR